MGKLLYPKLQDKDWLYSEYVVMGKTMKHIADEVGTYACVVLDAIRKHSIPVRGRAEHLKNVPFTEDHKNRISKALLGQPKPWQKGEKNSNWKGGIYFEDQLSRIQNIKRIKEWRKFIINRDVFCVNCGTPYNLCAHHIKSWHDYPELRFDVWNGAALCNTCHTKYHRALHKQMGLIRRTPFNNGNAEPAGVIA